MVEESVNTLYELESKLKRIKEIIGTDDLNLDIKLGKQIILFDDNGTHLARICVGKQKGFI